MTTYRVFLPSPNEKITLKPLNERSQQNVMLQKTHKYTTYPSLRSGLPKSLTQVYRALYGDAMRVN